MFAVETETGEKHDEGIRFGGRPLKQRRSRLEVHLDVLYTIRNGVKKPTRIMYGANLSWKPLQRVLDSLIQQELVMEVDPVDRKDKRTSVCYDLTKKGENILGYFSKASALLELEETPRIDFRK
jgi:predicted transcriptional regulator